MPSPEPQRFLLTNDEVLSPASPLPGSRPYRRQDLEAALPEGAVSTIIAPSAEHSACSHQVTTSRPIRASRLDRRHIAVDSLPADCVRIALHELRDGFDWVLAGINHGATSRPTSGRTSTTRGPSLGAPELITGPTSGRTSTTRGPSPP